MAPNVAGAGPVTIAKYARMLASAAHGIVCPASPRIMPIG